MGTTTSGQGPTQTNPYGLSPSTLALMGGLSGLSNAINPQGAGSANYMRPSPGGAWSQGSPTADQLLLQLMQMRQTAMQGLADPYQAGVAAPRVSLLQG
jgi:hypothetical protein